MSRHAVVAQRPGTADHAAPDDPVPDPADRSGADPAAVAQYTATLLPGVLWLLGVHVFDGTVPAPLQGAVGLLLTGACTLAVGWARNRT